MNNDNNYFSDSSQYQKKSTHRWVNMPLPSRNTLLRFVAWGIGRLAFSAWLGAIEIVKNAARAIVWGCNGIEKATYNLLKIYDHLPTMGMPMIEMEASITGTTTLEKVESFEILPQVQNKHCLIIGNTGSGKSTLTQWFASQCQKCKVYDPDAAPGEWGNLEVIGKGGNFEAINKAMTSDLVELQTRIKIRSEEGDKGLLGYETCLIAEEFPALKDECQSAPDWLGKIARRGRKPKMFLIILSQSDNVKTLGIEGEGSIRQNFALIRLGKFAVDHARRLKNDALVEWLKAKKYRCLVEDIPVELPDLSNFQNYLPQPLLPPLEVPEVTGSRDLQRMEVFDGDLITTVKTLIKNGKSRTFIIENILGYKGRKFEEGKQKLREILGDKNDNCEL